MPDIRDVHHVEYIRRPIESERARKRIGEQVGAHVAQMLRQVNGRAAGVVGDDPGFSGTNSFTLRPNVL